MAIDFVHMAAHAEERHATHLAEYREGVRRMALSAGNLSTEEAERVLHASRELGIPAERISTDGEIMLRACKLESEIEAVLTRNASQREPLPRLKAELDAVTETWLKVRVECEQRLKAAEAELNAATNAYNAVERLRDERVDQQQADLNNVRNAAPWLFGDVSAATLRRFFS